MFHDFIETFMHVYIGDIVIKYSSKNGRLDHFRQSCERMRKYGLKTSPLKCAFHVHVGEFLNFMIHKKGIEIN